MVGFMPWVGKVGPRWWVSTFCGSGSNEYRLSPTRSAEVPKGTYSVLQLVTGSRQQNADFPR